jgi:hypothetical protein
MKIVIYSSLTDFTAEACAFLENCGHVVMALATTRENLFILVARHTPHFVVARAHDYTADVVELMQRYYPDIRAITSDTENSHWQEDLKGILTSSLAAIQPRPYADDQRIVLHDSSLQKFSAKKKLKRPEREGGWEKVCVKQEARFIRQLQGGQKNHQAAKLYLEHLQAQQPGLDGELYYRISHGSYKGLSWARDLAVRWLSLLAHYVPEVELQYLPLPTTPGPTVDYVHHLLSPEALYAVMVMLSAGMNPAIESNLRSLVVEGFEGQDDTALAGLSLSLFGLAKYLEGVARAQVSLMDGWLDPVHFADSLDTHRTYHRRAGTFRDFHDLAFIVSAPHPLIDILQGFHWGSTDVINPNAFPSFREVFQVWAQQRINANHQS